MNSNLRFGRCAAVVLISLASGLMLHGIAEAQHDRPHQPTLPAKTAEQGADDKPESDSFWMEQKLRLSQEILKGLANGDFDQIGKSAEVMRGLNRIEAFVRREPKGYRDYLRQFTLANDDLVLNAADENLAGATLAFNQLTISCVNCHRHLRESE